jgi:streptogramin lyase
MGNLDVVIAEYPAGEPGSGPYGLTAGPDDAVWFTQVHRGRIGRMSVSSPRCASSPLNGTDHATHREQGSMIRRYIAWRNRRTSDPRLRQIINQET